MNDSSNEEVIMSLRRWRFAIALVLALVSAREAKAVPTIVTPYIRSGTAAAVSCYVVNTGSTPAVVTIELVGVSGNVVSFAPDLAVAPGTVGMHTDFTGPDSFCRVTGINPRRARVTLCVRNVAGDCTAVATSP